MKLNRSTELSLKIVSKLYLLFLYFRLPFHRSVDWVADGMRRMRQWIGLNRIFAYRAEEEGGGWIPPTGPEDTQRRSISPGKVRILSVLFALWETDLTV